MSKATEQRVKRKIKDISKELRLPFNSLLNTLVLERFLVRVENSIYAEKLIFKGGMCLSKIIKLGRETKDIDFLLIETKGNIATITKIIEEISVIDIKDDFVFSQIKVTELSIEHKKYPGYRITLQGQLGQIKNKILIDISLGDIVRPKILEIELMNSKRPLFEKMTRLKSYPPEYIFSEKIEAILYLGESNSRMKDFYDCYCLIEKGVLNNKLLNVAITRTMENRGTQLTLIPKPTDSFETKWKSFLKKNRINNLTLNTVVSKINTVLKGMIK